MKNSGEFKNSSGTFLFFLFVFLRPGQRIEIYDCRWYGHQRAVESVEHSSMPRKNCAGIFDLELTFE
ncbi:hypothetical protein JCM6292_1683 [Bacteroides pyogenes JCM 6292]|uniref:Uncharacterized protein n=2 Tax=Bacteroides pyogenes TaxID=310300 RepID=W4PIU5_9BACE|nr:hypothetical protein JCM6292_1683 [Bacteroides pyogenes JCM 6292]GAE19059.1 hypothetical protein JCM6294_2061 [Bacteroides pyogenes DSM 20611 = JCM 6294]